MRGVKRKLQFLRNLLNRQKPEPDEITEEKWIADFSRQKHARFDIKSESSYDANLRKNLFYSGYSLVLGLKKSGCIAWVEAPEHRYRDLIISGSVRIDARGGYGAAGMNFRMVDSGTYYSLLVSNKGFFRVDALRNGMPFPLVGWTELPFSNGAALSADQAVDFSIIAYGSHLLILLRGRWAAEVNDSSILEGTIGFTAVSYETGDPAYKVIREVNDEKGVSYSAEAFLESLTVDSRITEVSVLYEKWHDNPDVASGARLNLAETFTAMNQADAAMTQLRRAWDTSGHRKTQAELLLAGRLAQQLGIMDEAEIYISQCFEADVESHEGRQALVEMARIIYSGERYGELKDYCTEAVKIKPDDSNLWTFLGHAYWNLKENRKAASAYDKAFELDRENGILAKNAANVYDVMGKRKEALARYLEAGRAFLNDGNYNDLGLLVPKLLSMGSDNWEAHGLAGKWAFAVEDIKMAEAEFRKSEDLRKTRRPKPPRDGAQVFLEALLLIRAGKRRDAIPLLKEAASLEKDFALFHFRLAENLFLLDDNPDDLEMLKELNTALTLLEKEEKDEDVSGALKNEGLSGWVSNFAAQVALRKGNLDAAAKYLSGASKVLGDLPAVRVNQGVLFSLRGAIDKALEVLDSDKRSDPEGIMANCAGNILVHARRFEEADEKYRKALAAEPDNVEYLCNRASCLIELGLYGEADELLARGHAIAPGADLLVMISYVAVKKGEYARAEQACRSALEMDPLHAQSLLSLGWVLLNQGKHEETRETIRRLDELNLKEDSVKGREELKTRLDDLFYKTIECESCGRLWKVVKDPPPVPAIRLFAMPPDDLPAGTCPECGKSYCIGCAKNNLDSTGRFICSSCSRSLKLINEGLKKIVHDWAAKDGLIKAEQAAAKTSPRASKKVSGKTSDKVSGKASDKVSGKTSDKVSGKASTKTSAANANGVKKSGRGRPRKSMD